MAESSSVGRSASSRRAHHHDRPSVCVVGVGTVGLHEALAFEAAGHDTAGYDIDGDRIRAYRRGTDPSGTVDDVLEGTARTPVVVDLPGVFDTDCDDAAVIYRDVSDVS